MADSISDLQKDTFYWQRLLRLAGYYHGAIDGIPGNGTRNGTERWSTDADRQKAARQWFKLARNEAVNQGYEAKIICGTRTYAEQNDLYRQRPKVTNARGGQSWHNFGLAWDFGIFQDRNYLPNHPLYTTLGKLYAQTLRKN